MSDSWAKYDSKRRNIIPSWQSIRSIYRSKFAQIIAYIPLVAIAFFGIESFGKMAEVDTPFGGVNFLVLGSLTILFANLMFLRFCPREIKVYASDVEFAKSEIDHLSISTSGVFVDRTSILDADKRFKDFALRESEIDDDADDKIEIIRKFYNIKNRFRRKLARLFVLFLYGLGTFLLAVPTLQNFAAAFYSQL